MPGFFYCQGQGWAGIKKFYCRGRGWGWAGIKLFEMTGVGPGLEKLKMPGPDRDRHFFYCRGRAGIFLLPGPRPGFFLLPGPGRDLNFFIAGAGAGPSSVFFIAGAGTGPGLKILKSPGPDRDWKN